MRKAFCVFWTFVLVGMVQTWVIDFPSLDGRFSSSPYGFDTLRNTSRLTNEELRYGFERLQEFRMARELDRDRDGLVDFIGLPVEEFIERMKIILSDRRPFQYVYGNGAHVLQKESNTQSAAAARIDI